MESFLFSFNGFASKLQSIEAARLKLWIETMDKGATLMYLFLMDPF
jgi:hypothetical protein